MGAENRLSADQLAALAPGDVVTIESGLEFGRRRYTTGTVGRVGGSCIYVSSLGVRGTKFVERFSLRDGVRVGGGNRSELVDVTPDQPAAGDMVRRRTQRIDALYRAWSRRRHDVEALRALHDAIGEYIGATAGTSGATLTRD